MLKPLLVDVASEAHSLGMTIAIENHADFAMADLVRLVEAVAARHVGICFDSGNAVLAGPHIRMVHLKDLVVQEASRGNPDAWWSALPGCGQRHADCKRRDRLETGVGSRGRSRCMPLARAGVQHHNRTVPSLSEPAATHIRSARQRWCYRSAVVNEYCSRFWTPDLFSAVAVDGGQSRLGYVASITVVIMVIFALLRNRERNAID